MRLANYFLSSREYTHSTRLVCDFTVSNAWGGRLFFRG